MFSIKDIESGIVFEKCTIQEITDVEKKLRQDIEKKKEDLRQMVGERYRELIEAADTITDMKNGTEKVSLSITKLQELCQSLKQSAMSFHKLSSANISRPLTSLSRDQLNKFTQAICMKIFMDIPNKIWSCLDREEYLNATRMYLLSQHLESYLKSGLSDHTCKLVNMIVRQWTTITHLRMTIIKSVESKMRDSKLSEKSSAECMCSTILLKDISVEDVYLKFLQSREEVIQQHFESCAIATVKPLLCEAVRTVIITLHQVEAVFVERNREGGGLLISMLHQACNDEFFGPNGFDLSETTVKYLPSHVLGFRPSFKGQLKSMDKKFVAQNCSEFVKSSSEHFHKGIENLLGFVTTIKALADIRDAIHQLIKENMESCNWSSLCLEIVGGHVDIWGDLLRKHFLNKFRLLLQNQMDDLLLSTKNQVVRMLEDFADCNNKLLKSEKNLSSYIWSESASDIPQNSVWSPTNKKIHSQNREGSLHMKAKGFTPGVQSLCLSIDVSVKNLLDDVLNYMNQSKYHYIDGVPSSPINENGQGFLVSSECLLVSTPSSQQHSDDSFSDKSYIQDLLKTMCYSFLDDLLEFLKAQLLIYQGENNLTNPCDSAYITLQRVLYLARISSGLSDLSPSLQRCMTIGELLPGDCTPLSKSWKMVKHPSTNPNRNSVESKRWLEVTDKLDKFGQEVYLMWSDHVVSSLIKEFKEQLSLRNEDTYAAFISSCTQWDTTTIEEENEEGSIVKSAIKVPMQASWFVNNLLYEACLNLNRIGGHVIPSAVIGNLTKKLLTNVLLVYHNLLSSSSSSLHQSRSLQMWFDVKYLIGVLSPSKEEPQGPDWDTTSKEVLEVLEGHVDPFDLDVFRPYLKKHLGRLLQRTSTLYGLIMASERSPFSSFTLHSSSGQEQHHIVPLSMGTNRFPLLPLPQQVKQLVLDNMSKTSSKGLETSNYYHISRETSNFDPSPSTQAQQGSIPPPRSGSSSFLEQMSTLFSSSSAATTLYIK